MKKQIIITITFLLFLMASHAQGIITNINVSQGTGDDLRQVYISFDLSGSDMAYNITLEVSFDNGSSYAAIDNANVTGNLTVAPQSGINLIWDGGVNYPAQSSNFSLIKITATTFTCGDPLNYHQQDYATVKIGTQCWMAENLNYETANSWWYDNSSANGDVYGRLYTWEAANIACPSGWHLPNDAEWGVLFDYLGGSVIAGGKMKEEGTVHWWAPNTGATNSSGFSALPGGYRAGSSFSTLGVNGFWWSSTEHSLSFANSPLLNYHFNRVEWGDNSKYYGYSVRCLKN